MIREFAKCYISADPAVFQDVVGRGVNTVVEHEGIGWVLLQVAIASALAGYGVAYSVGVAYGFGLQAIEASVGIGVGLLFLAREGLSFAMLRVMPAANQAEIPAEQAGEDVRRRAEGAAAS